MVARLKELSKLCGSKASGSGFALEGDFAAGVDQVVALGPGGIARFDIVVHFVDDCRDVQVELLDHQTGDFLPLFVGLWLFENYPNLLSDLVIDPAHRNHGVYTKIMKAALKDLAAREYTYVFNLSANPVNYLGSLMAGWRSAGALQTARWRSKQGTTYRLLHRYISRLSVLSSGKNRGPFYSLDRNGVLHRGEGDSHVNVERNPRLEVMAELVERIGNDGRIRHVRDQQYFAWRFQSPLSAYRFLYWQGARLEGYLVLRTSVYPHRFGEGVSIVDWEATNLQIRADLLQAAVLWGNFSQLTIWSETLPVEVKRVLQGTGFELSNDAKSLGYSYRAGANRTGVLVRPVREEMLRETDWVLGDRRLLNLDDWNLRMIYSDSF